MSSSQNTLQHNSAEFTFAELAELFGEESFKSLPKTLTVRGVSTDTRSIQSGNLFIALVGENFDSNTLLGEAAQKGAIAGIVHSDKFKQVSEFLPWDFPLIKVDDTLAALGKLAHHHRKRFQIPVIAISGAAGKTGTKDVTAHVLSHRFHILKTEANFNNQIGVPLTLLQLTSELTAAVIEIGTNDFGEIPKLTELLAPTHGLITNIGKEHLENLFDLDGVEQEECSLFRYLELHGGTKLVNNDDSRLCKYTDGNVLTFSIDRPSEVKAAISFDTDLHPTLNINQSEESCVVVLNGVGFPIAFNSICAVAVALSLGMTLDEIALALSSYPEATSDGYGRMVLEHLPNGAVLLNDCYNANPDSMLLALRTLKAFPREGRKIALLGDMKELGRSAYREHISLITYGSVFCSLLLLVGDDFGSALEAQPMEKVRWFEERKHVALFLQNELLSSDVLLVKGSRGMKMEEFIGELRELMKSSIETSDGSIEIQL